MVEQTSLIVRLQCDGLTGWGEVTQNRYYNRTLDSLGESVRRAERLLPLIFSQTPESVWPKLMEQLDGDTFAVSAIDNAAHDWHARKRNMPTWQYWGLQWQGTCYSSYTIAIDSIDKMLSKLAEQPRWPIYKIKLGTREDVAIIKALRQVTSAVFRVDANCGWTADQTIEMSEQLKDLKVEFIEQPLPREASDEDQHKVFQQSALPIIADESCQTENDVQACSGKFHGINVKVCKCGGLTPALRMLRQARQLGMKTMVGCMVESAIGISAAAQLLPLLDYADLDGSVLLASDPTVGVSVVDGRITPRADQGHGAYLP